jgi:hypothetical protein
MPFYSNFIGPNSEPIDLNNNLWNSCLPTDYITAANMPQTSKGTGISYGDYFTAIGTFLTENNHYNLLNALNQVIEPKVSVDAIQAVDIHLIKHGKYYHPSHVLVKIKNEKELSFVLNVAISADGRRIIAQEYQTLKYLNAEFPVSFLPKVFTIGQVFTSFGAPIQMFLGEWFHDFHEFHLSSALVSDSKPNLTPNQQCVVIWNDRQDTLDNHQTLELIQKASMILTFYYNPETSEHIFPWHHAAGDFVVKLGNNKLALKLISARGYIPLIEGGINSNDKAISIENMLDALLAFFIHLSLQMRMDRVDGVGSMEFYGDDCMAAVVNGFFQGLDLVANMREYPNNFCSAIKAYFNAIRSEELVDLVHTCISRYTSIIDDEIWTQLDLLQHVRSLNRVLALI